MKKSPLLLLILAVFIAGCTANIPFISGQGGSGVIFKDFSTLDTNVEPDTPVTLNLAVANTGTEQARGVTAQLYYLPEGVNVQQGKTQSFGDLNGANPSRQISGEENSFQWTLTAPAKDTDMQYNPKVRISYGYTTVVNLRLKAVTIDWYKQKKEKGGIDGTPQQTGGPLTITATSVNSLISGGKAAVTFSIQNNGGGRVYSGGSPTGDSVDSLSYSVSGGSVSCRPNPVRLMNDGTSNKVVCTIYVSTSDPVVPIDLTFKTDYNYYIDRSTTFTVLQKLE